MAVLLTLRGPVEPAADQETSAARPPAPAFSPAERKQADRGRVALQAAGEDVHGHAEQPPPGVERAGREFLRFYLPYEVGGLSASIEAGLRATATPEFAAQLLQSAPRFPPGLGKRPAEAQVLAVDPVALADESNVARIVGKLRRGQDVEAVAFELRLIGGRWLVSGVAG